MITRVQIFDAWKECFPSLIAICNHYRISEHDRDDILQDLILLALQGKKFESSEDFFHWCRKSARFRCLDVLAKNTSSYGIDSAFEHSKNFSNEETDDVELDSNRPLITELRIAVKRLPPAQRAVMSRTLEGLTDDEIVEQLQKKAPTVRSLRRHAVAALARLFSKTEATPSTKGEIL
ncbi:MAG: sigma-70 family RNA polymerase sigma factor [Pirellulales bacterium]